MRPTREKNIENEGKRQPSSCPFRGKVCSAVRARPAAASNQSTDTRDGRLVLWEEWTGTGTILASSTKGVIVHSGWRVQCQHCFTGETCTLKLPVSLLTDAQASRPPRDAQASQPPRDAQASRPLLLLLLLLGFGKGCGWEGGASFSLSGNTSWEKPLCAESGLDRGVGWGGGGVLFLFSSEGPETVLFLLSTEPPKRISACR